MTKSVIEKLKAVPHVPSIGTHITREEIRKAILDGCEREFKRYQKLMSKESKIGIEPLIENSNATDEYKDLREGNNPLYSKGDMLRYLDKMAREYVVDSQKSIARCPHMNKLKGKKVNQDVIDAVVVDFVNFIADFQGLDYGMYTKHLRKNTITKG